MGGQTEFRTLRRRWLFGIGVLGVSFVAPWILRPTRAAASGGGDGSADRGLGLHGANESAGSSHATLYEEDQNDPQGRRFPGAARWKLIEKMNDSSGMLETSVRASVAIPERGLIMALTLRRNDDKSLPASHLVEFAFTLPPDAPRAISNVPGILMKQREDARGTPLSGTAVRVTDTYYMIGLSAVEADEARNLVLLKSHEWFDVPIVYSDGHRAILAFQKGETGWRVFARAFAAWEGAAREVPPPSAAQQPSSPQKPVWPPKKFEFPPDIIK
ncbi:MAG TPA: hypothetical protein VKX28_30360 [Xanthobacteraceae bacterium]|nr:hypothetical protein [Xanthobacteraceae bacterium]